MQDKELKELLKSLDVPQPSGDAQSRAHQAAMQAFEMQREKKYQGSAKPRRLTPEAQTDWAELFGRFTMKRMYVFAGSFAAVALVLAITTTHYSTIMSPVMVKPEVEHDVQTNIGENAAASGKGQRLEDKRQLFTKHDNGKAESASVPSQVSEPMPGIGAAQGGVAADAALSAVPPMEARSKEVMPAAPSAPVPMSMPAFAAKRMASVGGGNAAMDRIAPYPYPQPQIQYQGNDQFENYAPNPVKLVTEEPVSTFSIDVDTSSYSFVRRSLNSGLMPPKDAVRIEEMVNYFDYDYPLPESKDVPFQPSVTVLPTPWNTDTKLLHVGIKGYDVTKAQKPRSNLVFLIDVSGSMNAQDRLPLVKNAMRMLVDQLQPEDMVGIVVYAGNAGTVLEPTKVADKTKILEALNRLEAGGSTAGGAGIELAYSLAQQHFDKEGVNRVILSTDGDFNVGITDPKALQEFIERKRETGIFLSILGFGQGNYNDALMQKLAQHGNGSAAYIDNLNEARKVLVEEAGSTLFPIAKDVKIQIEFNPVMVAEYRLIGYESRLLKREDFNNDKVDAGEIGSGHAVTAIYEITPSGSKARKIDTLRYQQEQKEAIQPAAQAGEGEYAFLKLRYKLPSESESRLLTTPVTSKQEVAVLGAASADVRFAVSVAAFGQLLKGDARLGSYTYDDVLTLAEPARGKDTFGYRAEFLNLVRLAKTQQP